MQAYACVGISCRQHLPNRLRARKNIPLPRHLLACLRPHLRQINYLLRMQLALKSPRQHMRRRFWQPASMLQDHLPDLLYSHRLSSAKRLPNDGYNAPPSPPAIPFRVSRFMRFEFRIQTPISISAHPPPPDSPPPRIVSRVISPVHPSLFRGFSARNRSIFSRIRQLVEQTPHPTSPAKSPRRHPPNEPPPPADQPAPRPLPECCRSSRA